MPEREEVRTARLWCADCDHVFRGEARFMVHTVEDSPEPVAASFHRAVSRCPNCGSSRVGDAAERPQG
jgi:hypothetical protein